MQHQINNDHSEINYKKQDVKADVDKNNPPSERLQDQLFHHHEAGMKMPLKQQEEHQALEQARLEARRESNRRSARNGRIRQKNLVISLEAEKQILRSELAKAYKKIDELKAQQKEEAGRTLEVYRRFRQVLENNQVNEQHHQQTPHQSALIGDRDISSRLSLPSLLQVTRTIDAPSFE